jgi:hypothetical protein
MTLAAMLLPQPLTPMNSTPAGTGTRVDASPANSAARASTHS